MYKDEVTLYRHMISRDPDCWMAQNNLGAWLYEHDRKDEALAQWRAVIRIKPDHPEAHNNIGRVLSERNQNEEALKWCSRAVELRPGWGPVHWNVARLLTKTGGNPQLAEYHFLEGLKQDPTDPDALYDLGVLLGEQGRYADALPFFERLVVVNPQRAAGHHALGAVLLQLNRMTEASDCFHKALSLDPNLVEAHTDLGNYWYTLADYPRAAHHYQEALRQRPEFWMAAFNLAATYRQLARPADAVRAYQRVLGIRPTFAEAHLQIIAPLIELSRFEEAQRALDQTVAFAGNNLSLLVHAAWILATSPADQLRDGPRAVAIMEPIDQATNHQAADVLNVLAAAYASAGRFDEARDAAQEGLTLARNVGLTPLAQQLETGYNRYLVHLPLLTTDAPAGIPIPGSQ